MSTDRRMRAVLGLWSLTVSLSLPACDDSTPKPVSDAPPPPAKNDPGPARAGTNVKPIQVR